MPWHHFCIYSNPSDFPGKWVVRRWAITELFHPVADVTPLAVCESLADARAALPPGLVRISRHQEDDPAILETWL